MRTLLRRLHSPGKRYPHKILLNPLPLGPIRNYHHRGTKDTEIQNAFIQEGGFQCGYCTSGFLVNAYALLEAQPDVDDEGAKEWLQSNLCRCTGYEGISKGVKAAQREILSNK